MIAGIQISRVQFLVWLSISVLFQAYVAFAAQRQGVVVKVYLESIEAMLPLIARTFYTSYQFWWGVPIIGAILAIDVARRDDPHIKYSLAVLAFNFLTAFAFQAWANASLAAPFILLSTANRLA